MRIVHWLVLSSFVFFAYVTGGLVATAATVNINGVGYAYNLNNTNKWITQPVAGSHVLDATDLHRHLTRILASQESNFGGTLIAPRNLLREVARMILAQQGTYNVAANNSTAYITQANRGHVHDGCETLVVHLLQHGHLGYFPMVYVIGQENDKNIKVNSRVPRGMFKLPSAIKNRIIAAHRNVFNLYLGMVLPGPVSSDFWGLPNRLSARKEQLPGGYHIDPAEPLFGAGFGMNKTATINNLIPRVAGAPTLKSYAGTLIDRLMTTTDLAPTQTQISAPQNNRFTITTKFTYNGGYATIGENRDGEDTQTLKIVIEVVNGKVKIVTMYPQ